MTKHIRIENADTTEYKVSVFVEQKQTDGTWVRVGERIPLDHPTALHTAYITSHRRLVVEEA